ncbi:MAG: chaperonin GroEL [Nanoarchaeota archaeon]
MISKQIIFNEEARRALQRGIDKVANIVKVTLGPRGRTVILDKPTSPLVSNDGVTIAKEIELKDKFENMGAKLMKEVASQTQDKAGDGTTTATVLAQTMIAEGLKNIAAGANPVEIKRGIELATEHVVQYIKSQSSEVKDRQRIAQVATISANNDEHIGKLIAEAMEKVGSRGVITVEESQTLETSLDLVEGMQLDRGYLSPYMATDHEKMEGSYENAYILITDQKIAKMKDLLPVLESCAQESKPLFIIAEDVEGEALTALVINAIRGALKVCAIKAPGFGDEKKEILEDIAILTGARVLSEEKGDKLEDLDPTYLGHAKKIKVDKDMTTIIQGAGNPQALAKRINQIETQIKDADMDYKREELQRRLAKLSGGVAVINVGAATETELKEKKLRIDDALHATKAAVEEGVVTGGGMTLFRAIKTLEAHVLPGEQAIGANIVKRALEEPLRMIAFNAGKDGSEVIATIKAHTGENIGFNAKTNVYEDLVKSGVIDPTKVVRTGLQNAASIAGMVITTEGLVADFDDEKDEKTPQIII